MLQDELLADLLDSPESDRLEFKRDWYNLDSNRGKGQFVRDVLAMANSVREGEPGYIVIGVTDESEGGELVGVEDPPDSEQVAQILGVYTNPVPRVRVHHQSFEDVELSIIEMAWSDSHPHYATRDVDRVLSTSEVYVRRDDTVGRLKPVELEGLIRAKEARLGSIRQGEPIQVGFVEVPKSGGYDKVTVRVANLTEEEIDGISAVVDTRLAARPPIMNRRGLINNMTLYAGQSREFGFRLSSVHFYDADGKAVRRESNILSNWIDVSLSLVYRGRDGFFREITRQLRLAR